jgi:hypothetical protein
MQKPMDPNLFNLDWERVGEVSAAAQGQPIRHKARKLLQKFTVKLTFLSRNFWLLFRCSTTESLSQTSSENANAAYSDIPWRLHCRST